MARKKAKSDPSKPKRPQSPFFLFMSDFRVRFRKENPDNKYVSVVGKAAGEKWRSMSDDKAPYVADAEKKKMEYVKAIHAYNKKVLMACNNTNLVAGKKSSSGKSFVKSNSELNDDDDDDDDNEEEEEEDDEDEDDEGINSVREK
ncbi:high mobility group (HMG)-box protein [Medicago truncatula]|uniref:High mobility group (HMG)-box protein n=1 Tax=Medicago truncatula TaxID=3880 RepID=G7KV91_MEDTR|nr:high mobility group (HMG)-box protein [Medicago truncatula]